MIQSNDYNSGNTEFIFFSLKSNCRSRTRNYFNGMRKKSKSVRWIDCSPNDLIRMSVGKSRGCFREDSRILVVSSPSHILVFYIFILLQKRPILDAGWPLSDGVIASRKEYGYFGLTAFKTFLLDFFSFHLSKKVFVESNEQKKRVCSNYFLSPKKVFVVETGFDEDRFDNVHPKESLRDGAFTSIIFRGGNQVESGLNVLIQALESNLLDENTFKFRIITNSYLEIVKSKLLVDISVSEISDLDLLKSYQKAGISLGQLSKHRRVTWTIPHKFYEAAFLGLVYVSTDHSPFMVELSKQGDIAVFEGGSLFGLVNLLNDLAANPSKCHKLSVNLKSTYQRLYSQEVLSRKFEYYSLF